jgi:hypothetical protein
MHHRIYPTKLCFTVVFFTYCDANKVKYSKTMGNHVIIEGVEGRMSSEVGAEGETCTYL